MACLFSKVKRIIAVAVSVSLLIGFTPNAVVANNEGFSQEQSEQFLIETQDEEAVGNDENGNIGDALTTSQADGAQDTQESGDTELPSSVSIDEVTDDEMRSAEALANALGSELLTVSSGEGIHDLKYAASIARAPFFCSSESLSPYLMGSEELAYKDYLEVMSNNSEWVATYQVWSDCMSLEVGTIVENLAHYGSALGTRGFYETALLDILVETRDFDAMYHNMTPVEGSHWPNGMSISDSVISAAKGLGKPDDLKVKDIEIASLSEEEQVDIITRAVAQSRYLSVKDSEVCKSALKASKTIGDLAENVKKLETLAGYSDSMRNTLKIIAGACGEENKTLKWACNDLCQKMEKGFDVKAVSAQELSSTFVKDLISIKTDVVWDTVLDSLGGDWLKLKGTAGLAALDRFVSATPQFEAYRRMCILDEIHVVFQKARSQIWADYEANPCEKNAMAVGSMSDILVGEYLAGYDCARQYLEGVEDAILYGLLNLSHEDTLEYATRLLSEEKDRVKDLYIWANMLVDDIANQDETEHAERMKDVQVEIESQESFDAWAKLAAEAEDTLGPRTMITAYVKRVPTLVIDNETRMGGLYLDGCDVNFLGPCALYLNGSVDYTPVAYEEGEHSVGGKFKLRCGNSLIVNGDLNITALDMTDADDYVYCAGNLMVSGVEYETVMTDGRVEVAGDVSINPGWFQNGPYDGRWGLTPRENCVLALVGDQVHNISGGGESEGLNLGRVDFDKARINFSTLLGRENLSMTLAKDQSFILAGPNDPEVDRDGQLILETLDLANHSLSVDNGAIGVQELLRLEGSTINAGTLYVENRLTASGESTFTFNRTSKTWSSSLTCEGIEASNKAGIVVNGDLLIQLPDGSQPTSAIKSGASLSVNGNAENYGLFVLEDGGKLNSSGNLYITGLSMRDQDDYVYCGGDFTCVGTQQQTSMTGGRVEVAGSIVLGADLGDFTRADEGINAYGFLPEGECTLALVGNGVHRITGGAHANLGRANLDGAKISDGMFSVDLVCDARVEVYNSSLDGGTPAPGGILSFNCLNLNGHSLTTDQGLYAQNVAGTKDARVEAASFSVGSPIKVDENGEFSVQVQQGKFENSGLLLGNGSSLAIEGDVVVIADDESACSLLGKGAKLHVNGDLELLPYLKTSDDCKVHIAGDLDIGGIDMRSATSEVAVDGTLSIAAHPACEISAGRIEASGDVDLKPCSGQGPKTLMTGNSVLAFMGNEPQSVQSTYSWQGGALSIGRIGVWNKSIDFARYNGNSYEIVEGDLRLADVDPIPNQTHTGTSIEPNPRVTLLGQELTKDADFKVSYEKNVNVGRATATIAGISGFENSKTVGFEIIPVVKVDLSKAVVSTIDDLTYTGEEQKPGIVVKYGGSTLRLTEDYSVKYENNTNAGTATLIVTGTGQYTGTRRVSFKILAADISIASISAIKDRSYTGKDILPEVTAKYGSRTLKEGVDYTVSYKNNRQAGTASAIVGGKGNYKGLKSITFVIKPADISKATVSAIADQTYTGKAVKPTATVKLGSVTLKSGTDYTLSHKDNTNVGTATASVTGKGNYTGTATKTFKIVPADISKATVSSIADQAYTGNAVKPAPTVKFGSVTLKNGIDYTLSYKNNTQPGVATVTATGKGNYRGSVSKTFSITKPAVKTQVMHRLYNPNSGEHFYTAKEGERDALTKIGWKYEGVGWTAPEKSQTPVYRLYNRFAGDHHYTMKAAERDALVKSGWTYEGIGWYSDDDKGTPLYRQYNPNAVTGSHNYTTKLAENDALVKMGWKAEGIGWYGVKTN